MDDNGNTFVTNSEIHHIQMFSSNHTLITSVGSYGNNSLQFNHPLSVVISPTTKKIAVTEWQNHRVQILNPDLTFHSSIDSKSSGNGQLEFPCDVAFDSVGNMYVTNSGNHCVQVFTPEGKFL